jgi:hypothetical protein
VSQARKLLAGRRLAAAVVLVAIVGWAMRAAPATRAAEAGEHASAHASVIGGNDAQPGTFPWIARVLDLRGQQLGECSGTVIAPNLVLGGIPRADGHSERRCASLRTAGIRRQQGDRLLLL